MDNKLIIKRRKIYNEYNHVSCEIEILDHFFSNTAKYFKEENSIIAIKKMKDYLRTLKKKYRILSIKVDKIDNEVAKTCKHELLNNDNRCLICDYSFYEEFDQINHIIIDKDISNNESSLISDIIYEAAENNENIISVFNDYFNGNIRLKTKGYRRR